MCEIFVIGTGIQSQQFHLLPVLYPLIFRYVWEKFDVCLQSPFYPNRALSMTRAGVMKLCMVRAVSGFASPLLRHRQRFLP